MTKRSPAFGTRGAELARALRFIGRVDLREREAPRFAWSGSGFALAFAGRSLAVELHNQRAVMFKAVIDGVPQPAFAAKPRRGRYTLAGALEDGAHTLELYRQTEGELGVTRLLGIEVGDGELRPPPAAPARSIEVIGDSISAGYGNLGHAGQGFAIATESHWDSYAAIAARALGAELSTIAISGRGVYRNFDASRDVMPAYWLRALPSDPRSLWSFERQPDVVVINLGTNDFVIDSPPQHLFCDAYLAFAREVRLRYPRAPIVCAIGPLLNDDDPPGGFKLRDHRRYVQGVVAAFGRDRGGGPPISFLEFTPDLAPAGCDSHSGTEVHARMAAELSAELKRLLGW